MPDEYKPGMIYDAEKSQYVPFDEAAAYMNADWLENYACHETTLNLFATVKALQEELETERSRRHSSWGSY
jgi:hypothetical protein